MAKRQKIENWHCTAAPNQAAAQNTWRLADPEKWVKLICSRCETEMWRPIYGINKYLRNKNVLCAGCFRKDQAEIRAACVATDKRKPKCMGQAKHLHLKARLRGE